MVLLLLSVTSFAAEASTCSFNWTPTPAQLSGGSYSVSTNNASALNACDPTMDGLYTDSIGNTGTLRASDGSTLGVDLNDPSQDILIFTPAPGTIQSTWNFTLYQFNATPVFITITLSAGTPTLSSVSPGLGPTAGGNSVTLTGTNFVTGATVTVGSTPATGVTVNSSNSISAVVPAHAAGAVDVVVTTSGGSAKIVNAYTYLPAPTVTGLSVTSGGTGGATSVTITGTNFVSGATVTFGGTSATGVTVNNSNSISAVVPAHAAGVVDLVVTTSGGSTTIPSAYTYLPVPTVTGLSATSGGTGGATSVTITGTNFTGATAVTFGATAATSFTVNSATSITATSPAGSAGTVDVKVTTPGGTSTTGLADQFTYVATPTVTSLSVTSGLTSGGTTLTITGTDFIGVTAVRFGLTNVGFLVNSATSITVTAPGHSAGTIDVTVTTAGGTSATSASDQFTYIAAPTVTGISPTSGSTAGGTSVTITGTDFSGAMAVTFGATAATSFTVNSATSITATSPAGSAGAVDVTVATAGGTSATSASDQFTYIASPTVTSLSPTRGPAAGGSSVTITGANFSAVTAVTFGATAAASFTVNSATSITAVAPAGTGTVDVRVTTFGGTSATGPEDQFTYALPPTVTSISPNAGTSAGSTTVTITGTNLSAATAVKFGGTPATGFTVNSATSITATSPAGSAGTVDVTVTTAGGTSAISASDRFTYVVAPTVTSISPTWGVLAGGTTVTITGTDFTAATAVRFGSTAASSFTVNSPTSITATSPAASAGTVHVTVTTAGGTSAASAADQYTYLAVPTVSSASPSAGLTSGGTMVTILGANFGSATSVTFGGTAATSFTVDSATQITAMSPAGSAGTVDIRVTTPGGSGTLAGAFTYANLPSITSVSPNAGASAGGTSVTITGTSLLGATSVKFGSTSATSFTVNSATMLTAISPAGAGVVDVTVTTPGGTTAAIGADRYIYFTAPGAPAIGTATAGDGQANVSFTAPDSNGGAPITSYTVTSHPGGLVGTGSTSPIMVTGLTNGTAYTFTVTATSSEGMGAASAASNSVTPAGPQTITFNNPGAQNFGTTPTLTATASSGLTVTFTSSTTGVCTITSGGALTFVATGNCTIDANQAGNGVYVAASVSRSFIVNAVVPGAPVIGTATAGNAQAAVAFSAPAFTGGSTVTSYTVTSNPGHVAATGSTSPVTVTGLANGTSYTFTVTATNSVGTGAASAASNSALPQGVQTITFDNPGSQPFGTSPSLVATASSGLPVAFSSSTGNICTVTATGLLTMLSPGMCTINADQSGDSAYPAATRVSQSFAVVVPGGVVSITTPSLPAADVAVAYSLAIGVSGGASPYHFAVVSGALPADIHLSSATGQLTGTSTVSGSYSFTVRVTDAATQTADKTYTLTINRPTIVLTPAGLPNGQVAVAYGQQLTASGSATGGYSYAITGGALPSGLTLSPGGQLSGTPTAAGNYSITVTATDSLNYTGSQAYTFAISQPVPVAANDAASTPANASVTIPVTGNDTGPITGIAVAQAPAHGTATINGLNVVYAPNNNYYGTDTFTYTATGPGGTSAPATVTVAVTPLAVPVAQPMSATVLAGNAVTLHGAQGATGGPFTALIVATPPASGTLAIRGTDMVYTPTVEAEGVVSFDYTLSNAFGVSQPVRVTITVNPMPAAPALSAKVLAGSSVQVDLTTAAHGGPFTAATLVSVSPSNAGSANIQATASGYALTFTAAATFGGSAQVSYTLTNAYATSAPGNISVVVTARQDPSKDAEVLGILNAQADSARRMAQGQISNFQQRLESLHNAGGAGGFTNGITLTSANMQNRDPMQALRSGDGDAWARRYIVQPDEPGSMPVASPADARSLPGGITLWTGGALNFGKTQPGSSDNGVDFSTSGVSVGVDKRINDAIALGAGVGYGHDTSDIGRHGSRSTTDSYSAALYASYRPIANVYLDGLLGYQWLSFDSRRYVTGDGSLATGSRDGTQWFGSLALGYEHRTQDWLLSPYARLDLSNARLDAYTEQGQVTDTLSYDRQTVKTTTGNLGLRAEWTVKTEYGLWLPTLRAEYEHDFQGSSVAAMRYADLLAGPLYQTSLAGQSSNRTLLGAGIQLQTLKGWLLRFEYQNLFESSTRSNQSVLLGVEKKFDP
ncbi:IPT/TIG domain-containing protein [Dyella amyloliquefaciens]|uniref:IPT/TIG domain-containing protein n=1 Tax=Dyella amyloliquefaciens TaxID=1770545 RepID=UPI00197A8C89|nr:IPT/TIG domain-containing protein [Dyella amyloliquefaciens]